MRNNNKIHCIQRRKFHFCSNDPNPDLFFFQENCRLWGEEREDEALWIVYLKKVRYQRPSAIVQIVQASGNHSLGSTGSFHRLNDESPEDIAHLMWETVKVKVLKAGSLEKVVQAISNEDSDVQVRFQREAQRIQ